MFGTVVDWRSGVARARFHRRLIERAPLIGEVEGIDVDAVPVKLAVLNRENLETVLARHDVDFGTVPDTELVELNRAWEKLDPWPDSVEGLTRLKQRLALGPLSNGDIAGMLAVARFAGLPWDVITRAEIAHSYKPMPQTYLKSAAAVGMAPEHVSMVAAHNS